MSDNTPAEPSATAVAPVPQEQSTFQYRQSLVTVVTLANAAELTARVATKLNESGVSASAGGETLTDGLVHALAGSVFNKKIASELKG